MISYLKEVRIPKCQFKKVEILHISKGNNSHVNSLATLASSGADPFPSIMLVELLPLSSLTLFDKNFILSIHPSASWMDPIVAYLRSGILPEDKKESERIKCRSLQYWVSQERKLYKMSYSRPYLLCVHPEVVEVLLE